MCFGMSAFQKLENLRCQEGHSLTRKLCCMEVDIHIFICSFSTDGGRQIQRHNSFKSNTCFLTAPKQIQEKCAVLTLNQILFRRKSNFPSLLSKWERITSSQIGYPLTLLVTCSHSLPHHFILKDAPNGAVQREKMSITCVRLVLK